MSRSYKKHPWITDHTAKTTKIKKRFANKVIRQDKNFDIDGSAYKKKYCSWDICDYRWIWTKEEAIKEWYEEESESYEHCAWRHDHYKTLENWLSYWEKCVKRK